MTSASSPHTPITSVSDGLSLSWEGLTYTVKGRTILHGLQGRALPGRSLAVLGSSGAGKTTLLNAIAGRLATSGGGKSLSGRITINDAPYSHSAYKRLMGYVPQEDVLGPQDTPATALYFAARVRLGSSKEEARLAAEETMAKLRLTECRDTIVGVPGLFAGLSGGERKRLSIGLELIATTQQLLLCDEPTSGLDSNTSLTLVRTLQDVAREGNRTVIFTIHQPTRVMTTHFDDILLLTNGRVAYHGPMCAAERYFEVIGFPCPSHYTPTDHFMILLQDADLSAILVDNWGRYLALNGVAAAGGAEAVVSAPASYGLLEPVVKVSDALSMTENTNSAAKSAATGTDADHEEKEEDTDLDEEDTDAYLPAAILAMKKAYVPCSDEALRDAFAPLLCGPPPTFGNGNAQRPLQSGEGDAVPSYSPRDDGGTSGGTSVATLYSRPYLSSAADGATSSSNNNTNNSGRNTARVIESHLSQFKASPSIQWEEVFYRCLAFVYTNKPFLAVTVLQVIAFSLIAGLIFINVEDTIVGIQDRFGLFFMVIFASSLTNAMGAVHRFKPLREVFIREQQSGGYPPYIYFICSFIADVPLFMMTILVQSCIVYFLADLHRSAGNFFYFYAVLSVMCQVGLAIGFALSSLIPNPLLATAAIPCIIIPLMLVGGLMANNSQIRPYWYPMEKLSVIRSGFLLLVHLELPTITNLTCDYAVYGAACLLQPKTGDEYIHLLGFDDAQDQPWCFWLQLALMFCLLKGLHYCGLVMTARTKF